MTDTLRWPYNNMQKELGPYEHVGVNANQLRVGDLKYSWSSLTDCVEVPSASKGGLDDPNPSPEAPKRFGFNVGLPRGGTSGGSASSMRPD